jgi:hypothetical protein
MITSAIISIKQPETHVNVLCWQWKHRSDRSTPAGGTSHAYAWTASLGRVTPAGQATNQDLSGLLVEPTCSYK